MKIKCNHCEKTFEEDDLKIIRGSLENPDSNECCPYCEKSGGLMDIKETNT
jgi:hypothetical protein